MRKKRKFPFKLLGPFDVNITKKILSVEKKHNIRVPNGVNDHYTGLQRREFFYQKKLGRGMSFWRTIPWIYFDKELKKYGLW